MRKGITVICCGYNEEKRAEAFFKSVSMFDEIILVDRESTDRTCLIAERFHAVIMKVPHANAKEEYKAATEYQTALYSKVSNEWVLHLSFADIVHPDLYKKLINIINRENFNYAIISVPWVEYLFGKEDEYIPRCHYNRPVLRNMKYCGFPSEQIHNELSVKKLKPYVMKKNKRVAIHHMTYFELQYSFKEQQVRYAIQEVETIYNTLDKPKKEVFKTMIQEFKVHIKQVIGAFKYRPVNIAIHAAMVMLYRTIMYYLIVYLILWGQEKPKELNSFFEEIIKNTVVSRPANKINRTNIFKMWFKIVKNGFYNLAEDIFSFFIMLAVTQIMGMMIIWDNSHKIPVNEQYERLKTKILNDKLSHP